MRCESVAVGFILFNDYFFKETVKWTWTVEDVLTSRLQAGQWAWVREYTWLMLTLFGDSLAGFKLVDGYEILDIPGKVETSHVIQYV